MRSDEQPERCLMCNNTGKHVEVIAGFPPEGYTPKLVDCHCQRVSTANWKPTEPASEKDMEVYHSIADNYTKAVAPDVAELLSCLRAMVEVHDDECSLDHHGYCQTHFLDDVNNGGCRVANAKHTLSKYYIEEI